MEDQVGVKAPGKPTIIMFLPAAYSARLIFSGGPKSLNSVACGSLLPALMAANASAVTAHSAASAIERIFIVRYYCLLFLRNFVRWMVMHLLAERWLRGATSFRNETKFERSTDIKYRTILRCSTSTRPSSTEHSRQ